MQPLGYDHLGVEDKDDSHILGNSKFYLLLKTLVLLGKRSAVDKLKEGGQKIVEEDSNPCMLQMDVIHELRYSVFVLVYWRKERI